MENTNPFQPKTASSTVQITTFSSEKSSSPLKRSLTKTYAQEHFNITRNIFKFENHSHITKVYERKGAKNINVQATFLVFDLFWKILIKIIEDLKEIRNAKKLLPKDPIKKFVVSYSTF